MVYYAPHGARRITVHDFDQLLRLGGVKQTFRESYRTALGPVEGQAEAAPAW